MRIDVSEIKCFRECTRKHEFSSRNRYHLQPKTPNDNLVFGTQFHECLHMMYLGTPIEKIHEFIQKEVTNADYYKIMHTMVDGYYENVYPQDKERYQIVDIEKSFSIPALSNEEGEVTVEFCGSIDMIAIDRETNHLVGFEHKSGKNFRPDIYNLVDEQPRMYTIALSYILKEFHDNGKFLDVTEIGPIYLNQVRKLKTQFSWVRTECSYTQKDLERFLKSAKDDAQRIYLHNYEALPQPGFMKCQMCDYASLCEGIGYNDVDMDYVNEEFGEEYQVRDIDHLDEKVERPGDET